jgi:hypothetical protein
MTIPDDTKSEFKRIMGMIIADDRKHHAGEEDYDSMAEFEVIVGDDEMSCDYCHLRMKDLPVLKRFAAMYGLYMEKDGFRMVLRKIDG